MPLAQKVPSVVADRIIDLADDYARAIVAAFPMSMTPECAEETVAGALLSFLGDVVNLAVEP